MSWVRGFKTTCQGCFGCRELATMNVLQKPSARKKQAENGASNDYKWTLYNLHHQFPTYKYRKCQVILERFPTFGGSHHLSSTIYQLKPWFQKETWSKGFILDPLHRVWDIHHQQGIHWRSRRWKAGASDRLDTIQDLGSQQSRQSEDSMKYDDSDDVKLVFWKLLNFFLRWRLPVIIAWGPNDVPWSLSVYNNVRIWKKKTKSSGRENWDGLRWNRWWAASTLFDTASFGCHLHPGSILTGPSIIDIHGYEASNTNLNHPSSFQR